MKHKNMLLLFAALVIITGSLFATDSRMTALGSPFGFIRDNSDISSFPGVINKYKPTVIGELYSSGNSTNWTLGANLPVSDFVGGIYLNMPTDINVDGYISSNPQNGYAPGDLDISKKIQFYFGLLNSFGFGFGMAMDQNKFDFSDDPNKFLEQSALYFDVSGGISTDKLDAGGMIHYASAKVGNDFNEFDNEFSAYGIQGSGRFFVIDKDDLAVMAVGNLALSAKTKIDDYDVNNPVTPNKQTTDYTSMMVDFGAGANFKLAEGHTVIIGLKPLRFASSGSKYSMENVNGANEINNSYVYVPEYNLALESKIASWLVGRIGAMQNYNFQSYKNDPTGAFDATGHDEQLDSYYNSGFNMNIGLGFSFGKLGIDAVLSKSLLHDGPNFIGGKANGLASQISLQYNH